MSGSERTIYSIGHSNHPLESFLALLASHRIEALIDTRSHPHSKYAVQYNQGEIRRAVAEAGIRYLFQGESLGGRPEGAAFYDSEGYVLYARVAEWPPFLEAIQRLERGMEQTRIALMCSEENPAVCHRRLLVGRVLGMRGVQMLHIRGDGRLQTEAQLEEEERAARGEAGQTSLFEDEEVVAWKSLRSVLPKRRPPTFSTD